MLGVFTHCERKVGEPARIEPEVLILWGERDSFLDHHVAEAGLALCDNGRLTMIDGATHWLHLEDPGQVNAAILGFLADGQHH